MTAFVAGGSVIVVFAKAPRPGMVKTRMTPPLSPEQAAALYGEMLADVLEATSALAEALGIEPVVSIHPAEACAEFASLVPQNLRVIVQQGLGLSERMTWAVAEAAAGGAERILLRSSDSPVLGPHDVEMALDGLMENDVVVTPDFDGGYALIGLRAPVPGLFDHPMSTGSVLDETLANARRLGLRCRVLEPSVDLDTVADFAWLERAHAAGDTTLCPRTVAHFDSCGLWRLGRAASC